MKPTIRYIRFNTKALYEDYVKTTGEEILAQIKERRLYENSRYLRTLFVLRTDRAVN